MKWRNLWKRLLSFALCAVMLCGIGEGLAPHTSAATLVYETVYMISDFSALTGMGTTNSTLTTEKYRSGPSALKMAATGGGTTAFWRSTLPETVDLSCDGNYQVEDLGLAFWIYVDSTETSIAHLIQLCSAASWGGAIGWTKWRTQLTTATGQWAYVVIPLSAGNFDITNLYGYRFTQTAGSAQEYTYYIDDLQIVNLDSSSYSWTSSDVELSTALSKEALELDDEFTLDCTVKNLDTAVDMTNWTLKTTVNDRLITVEEGKAEQTFSVSKGSSQTISIPMTAIEGGSGNISLEVYDDQKNLITKRDVPVTIRGKREWYAEDVDFALRWSNDTPASGDTVSLQYTLTNLIDTADISNWIVSCSYSPLWASGGEDDHTLSVASSQSFDGAFDITFAEGGSGLFEVEVTDHTGKQILTDSIPITVGGTGYYLGDTHTHTTASDGEDTFLENFQAARQRGMSWIYATDHNAVMSRSYDRSQFDIAQDIMLDEGLLALYGTEVTTGTGHMVLHDIDKFYLPDQDASTYSDIPSGITTDAWRELLAEVSADGGISYLAHPFATTPYPGLEMDPTRTDIYTEFTGVEIINYGESVGRYDGNTVSSVLKTYGTEYWDRMNIKGEKKYFAWSCTDAHKSEDIAWFFDGLLLDELTEEAIHKALRTGAFYGSAGPELRFTLGGKNMGETVYAAAGADIPVEVKAYSDVGAITKVVLYSFDVNADSIDSAYQSGCEEAVILYEDADGSENRTFFEYTGTLPLKDNTFYRIEVYADDELYGYAFSNPIWMAEGEEPGTDTIAAKEDTVLVHNGEVLVSNPDENMTVAELIGCLSPSVGVKVYLDDTQVDGTRYLESGMTVRLIAGKDVLDELVVVLRSGELPQQADDSIPAGVDIPDSSTATYERIYTIDDFSKYAGVGRTNATYEPDIGHNRTGAVGIVPASSVWRTGYSVDLTSYTGEDTNNLALRFWVNTDNLTAGNQYTIQITSSASWGEPHMYWSFDPAEHVTETGKWTQVVLPFDEATNGGFDLSSYQYFRIFQTNTTTQDFTMYVDEFDIVRIGNQPVYETILPGERVEMLKDDAQGESFTLDGTPVILSDEQLLPVSVSGAKSAYLVAELWLENAESIDQTTSSVTASFGADSDNAFSWTVSGLQTGWNRLVLPISQDAVVGQGASYLFGENRVYALDTLQLNFAANTATELIVEEVALYMEEAEAPVLGVSATEAIIAALPAADAVTLEDEADVIAAKQAYDRLSDTAKEFVDAALVEKLDAVVAALEQAKANKAAADGVTALIDALPETVTPANKEQVAAARAAYDALTEEQKALVGEETLEKLVNAEEAVSVVLGDINEDGSIDASDALLALQHSVKLTTLEDDRFTAADVNKNGTVDATDALLILQYSVKLITEFPQA